MRSPQKLVRYALMLLSLWGFSGIAIPNAALAAASFERVMLAGFNPSNFVKPAFVDIDGDGDLDVFTGDSIGTLQFYRNDGTATAASFVPADGVSIVNPLAGVDVGVHAAPDFADIDNDGDFDAFIGESDGSVKFYRNDGSATSASFVAADGTSVINPLAGFDVGQQAASDFADIDNDGDLDVFIGESNGTVKFYQNNGSVSAPSFVAADGASVINPFAAFDAGGWAVPRLADIDNDGDLDAFIGVSAGTLKFYRNDGSASAPMFVAADGVSTVNPLDAVAVGSFAVPELIDIDGDGDLDAFIGSGVGSIHFHQNSGSATAPDFSVNSNPLAGVSVDQQAKPSFADIDNDGDLDVFIGNRIGNVQFYRNDGSASAPEFSAVTVDAPLDSFNVGDQATPSFADIDDDGDLDAFVGEYYGTVKFYRNDGDASAPSFTADAGALDAFDVGYAAAPSFADIDDDGDLDAFVGEDYGSVKFYRNDGNASSANFVAADGVTVINPLDGFDVGGAATPGFTDIDHDGDLDAFIGNNLGQLKFYQNNGSASIPSFVAADGSSVINPLDGFDVGSLSAPAFADLDNDGDQDAFIGETVGSVRWFENHEFEPSSDGGSSSGSGGGGGAFNPALLLSLLFPAILRRCLKPRR